MNFWYDFRFLQQNPLTLLMQKIASGALPTGWKIASQWKNVDFSKLEILSPWCNHGKRNILLRLVRGWKHFMTAYDVPEIIWKNRFYCTVKFTFCSILVRNAAESEFHSATKSFFSSSNYLKNIVSGHKMFLALK